MRDSGALGQGTDVPWSATRPSCKPWRMKGLSQAAQVAQTSLERDPDLSNPYAVFLGPTNRQRLTAAEIEHGLRELETAGLATHNFYGWKLVDLSRIDLERKE